MGTYIRTEEHKRKMSEIKKGHNYRIKEDYYREKLIKERLRCEFIRVKDCGESL